MIRIKNIKIDVENDNLCFLKKKIAKKIPFLILHEFLLLSANNKYTIKKDLYYQNKNVLYYI